MTDSLAGEGKETAIANLTTLHKNRVEFLERHLVKVNAGPFLTGAECSYADLFLYTSVKTVEETGGFGLLRDACNGQPFAGTRTISAIAEAVGEIDEVKASASKFASSPI